MSKTRFSMIAALLAASPFAATAAVVGSDAGVCTAGKPSVIVRVAGLKRASGTVKVAIYNSDPGRYLAKRGKLRRVVVPVRSTSPLDVCIAVPGPGRYAVVVHHDFNANGDKDGSDGLGYSGNPRLSITNLRPAFSKTGFAVGGAPKPVVVQMQYRSGLSIRPVAG